MSQVNRNKGESIRKKNNKGKKTKFDAVLQLLSFVYVVISIMFYIALIKMDMLP